MSSDDETVDIDELVGSVREDPNLISEEKEFTFTGVKPNREVQVYAEVAGMMRRLLVHPEFTLQDVRVLEGHRLNPDKYAGEMVTGVRGRVPVGCLKLRESPRSTSSPTDIISWRKRSERDFKPRRH